MEEMLMRKKSLLALTLATAMAAGVLAGCGNKNETTTAAPENNSEVASSEATGDAEEKNVDSSAYDGKKVKVWVANEIVGFTEKQIADFQEKNPQYKGVTFTVEAVGEGDAASNVITDVKAAADIYGFAQDQLTRLVTAGALEEVNPDYKEAVLSSLLPFPGKQLERTEID
jgi:arabinogalactan oligomer/maltooligosaccharide transport system substrate-binding protein